MDLHSKNRYMIGGLCLQQQKGPFIYNIYTKYIYMVGVLQTKNLTTISWSHAPTDTNNAITQHLPVIKDTT